MTIECPKCQHENPDGTAFCGKCGTKIDADIEPTKTIETPKEELKRGSVVAGRYEIIEELGKGGMGKVYKVEDTKVKEEVALKLIKSEIAADKKIIERFTNELRTARKIGHRNVGRMYDIGEEKGSHYITMEYVAGQDLKGLIRQSKRLAVPTAVTIAKEICDGLAEAHRLGVVHRDLKPSNIMIDKEGAARIMDFGIARTVKEKGITGSGVMIGTPEYMSPEQVEGKEADQRADIYSLGIILYEMLTGRLPFEADTPFAVGIKHKSEIPKNPRELNTQIPDELSGLILKCLEKEKNKRYQSAGDVRSELEKIEQGIPTSDRVALDRKPMTSKEITVKFTPKKLFIPIAVVIVLIAAGLFFLLKPKGPSLDPNRIVVAPFENKTGDPNLDNVGFMISDWITQGLQRAQIIHVSSLPITDAFSDLEKEKDAVQLIAKAVRAGKVVSGSYYLEGDTLQFVAQIHDVRQKKLLGSVDPVSGPLGETRKAIESLSQKVMGVLAAILDTIIPANIFGYMPNYDAYQAFVESWKAFHRYEWEKSIELSYEAMRLDPNFYLPLLSISAAYSNSGETAKAEEARKKVEAIKDTLSPWQKIFLEQDQAQHRGDRKSEYNAAKRAYELDPIMGTYNLAWCALRINRPNEAIEVFKKGDPESPWDKGWVPYWECYAFAYHMLGEHKKELKIARQARNLYPDRLDALWIEMCALSAMGRVKNLEALLDESQQMPPMDGYNLQELLMYSGLELSVHGFKSEALDFFERAIQWLKARPESETQSESYRRQMADILRYSERWKEAKSIYEDLSEENPDSLNYTFRLGAIAARLGDREEAQKISDELGKMERPYLFGSIPYYQACIASLLGEKDKAVKLLQESVNQGRVFGPYGVFHPNLMLEPLADYPPFQEFIKPKG
jgi:serine/threonine protein kinase/tetratricopeptide (TPR) repeat protein